MRRPSGKRMLLQVFPVGVESLIKRQAKLAMLCLFPLVLACLYVAPLQFLVFFLGIPLVAPFARRQRISSAFPLLDLPCSDVRIHFVFVHSHPPVRSSITAFQFSLW